MRAIAIPPAVLARIYDHARAAFPEECCGYLCGADDVDEAIPCRNAQADGEIDPDRGPDRGFTISGAELLAFARSFAGPRPARIVYHSHPNGRAYFSDTDRDMAIGAAYPVQHLVVGVTAEGVVECAQFSVVAGEIVELARWSP